MFFTAFVSDYLGLFFTETHMIGGSRLSGGDVRECSFFFALTQLQIEELPILLNVIQPLRLKLAMKEKYTIIISDFHNYIHMSCSSCSINSPGPSI